ncbi:MAG: histidine phosphatase family protein [Clostridia bacterium]|nr:histidine phosphatase family protein [Clostridia bacterium]
MILYIARHGESLGNTGEDAGINPALSEKGHIQAELLGKRMKNIQLDCILSSPLIRAIQTAEKTATLQNKQVEIMPDAFEVDNETTDEAYIRAKTVIETIKNRFSNDERVIIFAHGTFNNYLINAAIGFPVRDDFNFCQENTGLTCIKFMPDGKTKIEFSNDYCHLASVDEPEF